MIHELNPIAKLSEQLIFKLKKCTIKLLILDYSISQVASFIDLGHLKIDNFYEKQRVCDFCFAMYSKLDSMRAAVFAQKGRKVNAKSQWEIIAEIEKYQSIKVFLNFQMEALSSNLQET